MPEQYEPEAVTRIALLDGGYADVGERVLESGAIRYTLSLVGQDGGPDVDSLTQHDCAVISGELLRRSHAPEAV